MFQSEQLQEKWAHSSTMKVRKDQDAHRRSVTAVLLENQERFLREKVPFENGIMLTEQPTNSTNKR